MSIAVANDGVRIGYRVQGTAPTTLVFMHGWAGSGRYFDEVIEEIDLNALQVVTIDLRGHGDSDKAVKPYDLDRIADDVWTVVDAVGAAKIVVVGFSMSGKFAQYAAHRRPDQVAGLVLVSGFPASEIPFPQDVVRDWVGRAGDRERIRELLQPFVSDPVDASVFGRFLDDAATVPAPVLECTLRTCIETSFVDRVESLRMPILVVGGRLDPIFPQEAVAQLARSLRCARGISLPCNHEIPMERPRELAHAIESFVSGLGIGTRPLTSDTPTRP